METEQHFIIFVFFKLIAKSEVQASLTDVLHEPLKLKVLLGVARHGSFIQ